MAKKEEKQLPMDIPTLQSMVRKRDSIIAEINTKKGSIVEEWNLDKFQVLADNHEALKTEYEALQVKYQGLVLIHEGMMTDYESCCEQLKAREGKLKRTNEVLDARCKEYDELAKLYDANVKQLDQESDSNASLEDQITVAEAKAGLEAMKKGKGYFIGKTAEDYENEIKELEDRIEKLIPYATPSEGLTSEIKLLQDKLKKVTIPPTDEQVLIHNKKLAEENIILQEKLALCDKYYKAHGEKFKDIQNVLDRSI